MKRVVSIRDTRMDIYRCDPCRWIYYPERGDPTQGIPPGTPFVDLPDTWRCPPCKEPKSAFRRIERSEV